MNSDIFKDLKSLFASWGFLTLFYFQVGSVEQNEFNHDRAAESILNGLLNCGNYENIIKNIFEYLNATQLACLQKVSLNLKTQTKTVDQSDMLEQIT